MQRIHNLSDECQKIYGEKIWKASVNAGFTCPNIDGKCGYGGCIFCYDGSHYFSSKNNDIKSQIETETIRIHKKYPGCGICVYFQANTNTYAPIEVLKEKYYSAISMPYVKALSIATRADCLGDDVVELLKEISKKINLTVELGMQTSNDKTLSLINRGYDHQSFLKGYYKIKKAGIRTCLHIIIGLPGENEIDFINTAKEINRIKSDAVKLQLIHVIKNTELEKLYNSGYFTPPTYEEYIKSVCMMLEYIPYSTVIERLTGDGDKENLVAPLWSCDKRHVLNGIYHFMAKYNLAQGDKSI